MKRVDLVLVMISSPVIRATTNREELRRSYRNHPRRLVPSLFQAIHRFCRQINVRHVRSRNLPKQKFADLFILKFILNKMKFDIIKMTSRIAKS